MAKKRRRLNKRGKVLIIIMLLVLIVLAGLYFWMHRPLIVFNNQSVQIEIDGEFDAMAQIKKVRKGTLEDISVDTSNIDFNHLGSYKAIYTINDHSYDFEVEIVDTTAPEFETVDGQTDAGIQLTADALVKNVTDKTATQASFKENYDFSQEGVLDVVVVLTDEAGNKTEKNARIEILPKDETPPEIISEDEVVLQQDAAFDPLESVEIHDNQDPSPVLTVVSNDLDTSKTGSYTITYEGKDRSGNKATFKKNIEVVERSTIGREYSNGENIVYLTFDDGPSYNTPKILDILDKYNVKATFFVTGNGQEYNDCILRAYNSGHTIGLHTYSHDYSNVYSSKKAYYKDLNRIGDMVEDIIGHRPHYIRFPGGSSNEVSMQYTKGIMTDLSAEVIDRGYQYYDWNVSSCDASGNNVKTETIIKAATDADSGNLVILFHDASAKDTTVEALPKVIEYYQKLGFRFAPISDESYTCHHRIHN